MATKFNLRKPGVSTSANVQHPGQAFSGSAPLVGQNGSLWPATTSVTTGVTGQHNAASSLTGPITAGISTFVAHVGWMSPPVTSSFTISGSITVNLYGSESSMNANATPEMIIYKVAPDGTTTLIDDIELGTELGTTTALITGSHTPGAGVAMNAGDCLAFSLGYNDATATTMASGFTLQCVFDGSAGATGDGFVQFTETFSINSTAPAGTKYYLKSATETGVSVASEDSRQVSAVDPGTGSTVTLTTNPTAGPTAAFRATSSGGGNVTAWYSPALGTQTLTGIIRVNLSTVTQSTGSGAMSRYELVLCNGDGSSP